MERNVLRLEGKVQIGPKRNYFVMIDGEFLGQKLVDHFGLPGWENDYCELGNARITVELLQDSPTDQR